LVANAQERKQRRALSIIRKNPERFVKALVWHGKGEIRCEAVPDPKIDHGRDAIIKVTACAICGSDLHIFDGVIPACALCGRRTDQATGRNAGRAAPRHGRTRFCPQMTGHSQ